MALKETQIRHIARLARLHIPDDQLAGLTQDLSAILDWVAMLDELDLEDGAAAAPTATPMRDDTKQDGTAREKLFANAPATEGGYFSVPKVVD